MLPVTRVVQKDNNDNIINIYESLTLASQATGNSCDTINKMCINGRSKNGYKFEYENEEVKAIQVQREINRQMLKEVGKMINFNL